jgi:ATP-binding cassette subfamily B protein
MFKILRFLKPVLLQVLFVVVFWGAQAVLSLELPKRVGIITETVINGDPAEKLNIIVTNGGIMLLYALAIIGLAVINSLTNSYVATQFAKHVRDAMFKKATKLSLTEFEKIGTSSLITRTTNDVSQVQQLILLGTRVLVMAPVMFVFAMINTFTLNSSLVWVFAISVPLIFLFIGVGFVFASPLFEKIQKKTDQLTLVLRESLTGVRVVRAFHQQDEQAKRFDLANREQKDATVSVTQLMTSFQPVIQVIFDLTYLAIFFVGISSLDGQAEVANVGNIVTVAQYSNQLMFSILMFAFILIFFPRANASAKRINEVLDTKTTINDPVKPIQYAKGTGKIEFKNVTFKYQDASAPTLTNISFTAEPKKVTAIIGSTGSGKSSVINLIPRFHDVNEGHILIDGHDVRDFQQLELRSRIGFVPQQALLFSGSIRENMKYGKTSATDEQIWEALEVAQASNFVKKKEKQLDEEVSQTGKNFSGGQKQRLSIARALVKKPEIYIFDDAFSALDYKTDIALRQHLKTYTNNATVIIVAQRVSTIIDADLIVVLHEGNIVGQGKHQDLLKSCSIYKEIVYSQLDPEEINKTLALSQQKLSATGGE